MSKINLKSDLAPIEEEVSLYPSTIKIKNDDMYDSAREEYKQLRKIAKNLDDKKKSILRPMAEAVANVKSFFSPIEKRLDAVIDEYAHQLGSYANQKELERTEALKAIESDKRIKNVETIQKKKEEAGERLDGTMRVKQLVITDPSAVPNEYWVIDEKKLKEALLDGKKVKGALLEEILVVTSR